MSILNFDSPRTPRSNGSLRIALGAGAVAAIVAIASTLAATISINSGPVEFGQGVAQTSACDDSINITPMSSFVNSTDTSTLGSFIFTGIQVSDIDSSVGKCQGKTLTFKAYGDTETAALATYSVFVGETDFLSSSGTISSSDAGTSTGSFTLTFDPATISASDVYKITVESGDGFGGVPNGDEYLGNQILYIGENTDDGDIYASILSSGTFFGEDGMPQRVLMNYLPTSDPLFDERGLHLTNGAEIAVALAIGGDGQFVWNGYGLFGAIGCNSDENNEIARVCQEDGGGGQIDADIARDYSGILTVPNSQITYGSAISTVDATYETYTVQVKNTFTLDRNSPFLKVTTRVKNTGSTTLSNLRVWALNGDQMVGDDDSDIALKKISNSGVESIDYDPENGLDAFDANAIVANNEYGTAIMYSSTADAAVHDDDCCELGNLVFKDPSSITDDLVEVDGSYGLYFRLDDLGPGSTHEFTWFFGATTGSASNLATSMRAASRPDIYRP
jgi:hypothetical protein